jgi:hypothetical protein
MGQSMQCEQGDFRIIIWCGHVGKGLTLVDPDALITGYCVVRCPREGVTHSMPAVFFITHPDVAIDPSIPVADWPLNARGEPSCKRWQPLLGQAGCATSSPAASARRETRHGSSLTGLDCKSTASLMPSARMTDRRRAISPSRSSRQRLTRSLPSRKPAPGAGSPRQMPSRGRTGHVTSLRQWRHCHYWARRHRDAALLPSRRTADQPASRAARNKWWKLVRLRSGESKAPARRWRSSHRRPL